MEKLNDKLLNSKSILINTESKNCLLDKKSENFLDDSSKNFFCQNNQLQQSNFLDVFGLESHLNFNSINNLSNNFSKNKNECPEIENSHNLINFPKKSQTPKEKIVENQQNIMSDEINLNKNSPNISNNAFNCLMMLNKKGIPLLYDNNLDEEPRYVNAKQYNRMMIMRIKRAKEITMKNKKLDVIQQNQTGSKGYKYESRHQHAVKRLRGKDGKFMKKKDNNFENKKNQSKYSSKKQDSKESKENYQNNNKNQQPQNYQFSEELQIDQKQIFKEENNLILKFENEYNK